MVGSPEDESDKINESDPLQTSAVLWTVGDLDREEQGVDVRTNVPEEEPPPRPEDVYVAVCLDYYHDPSGAGARANGVWVGSSHGNYDDALGEAAAHGHAGTRVAIVRPGDWYHFPGEDFAYPRRLY